MLGLLCKDMRLIKNQGFLFLACMGIMGFVMAQYSLNPYMCVSYIMFVGVMYVLNTISYDGYDNGYAFLFTLPVSPKLYAAEKYVLTLILTSFTGVAAGIMAEILQKNDDVLVERFAAYLSIFMVMLCVAAVCVPIRLKFGAEKGQILMAALGGGIFLAAYMCRIDHQILKGVADGIRGFAERMGFGGLLLAGGLVVAALFLASMRLSMGIMSRKEF